MSDFQPKRPRLRLAPDSYRKLRTEVLERDGWRCQYEGSGTAYRCFIIEKKSTSN
jgi:hypothetical protein